MKYLYIVLGLLVVIGIGAGIWYTLPGLSSPAVPDIPSDSTPSIDIDEMVTPETDSTDTLDAPAQVTEDPGQTIIGQSAGGNDITAFHYGTGDRELLLVGGIHGGYSWNTALLAYELMEYLEGIETNLTDVRVTVIPVLNPDGLEAVVGTTERFALSAVPSDRAATVPGRFNDNTVDLNRNFDCEWQSTGTWQSQSVSGGATPFSEPETSAVRDYIMANEPAGVVVYYSAAGGVYSSSCRNGVLSETRTMTQQYATASEYPAYEEFDYYEITGDMVNWLAKEGIPGISVLLTDHQSTERARNIAGVEALINYIAE